MSDQIRWSLDLRWQRPDLPNGFYGLKDCITMAKSGEPGYAPDWTDWGRQDRTPMQKAAISADKMAEVSAAADEARGGAPVWKSLLPWTSYTCCSATAVHDCIDWHWL